MSEKSKKWATGIVGLLLIGVIVSAGCIGEKAPPGEGEVSPPAREPTTQTPTATPSGTSLSDLLDKAKGIGSYKYDWVMTGPEMSPMTSKVWAKGNNIRTEMTAEGQTVITIINGDKQEMYMYYPKQNMAMKMDFSQAPKSAVEEVKSIEDYNPTIIGIDTIEGKLCTVVEYVSPAGGVKMWLWQEHGFPLRMEVTTAEGTTRMDWKNIEFVDISDSMFELPAGVEIMEMPGGAP